ncbi:MAG: hypothetical protein AAGC55_24910, partial [Myxococcota bacterium]
VNAMKADIGAILTRVTDNYSRSQQAFERFSELLELESDPVAVDAAERVATARTQIAELLDESQRIMDYLDRREGAWEDANWSRLEQLLKDMARDETTGKLRVLAERLSRAPRNLRAQVNDWLADIAEQGRDDERMSQEDARAAIETIEPQMIIESMLSREWENWGEPRWLNKLEQKPEFAVLRDSVGYDRWREACFPRSESFDADWYGRHGDISGTPETGASYMTNLAFNQFVVDDD